MLFKNQNCLPNTIESEIIKEKLIWQQHTGWTESGKSPETRELGGLKGVSVHILTQCI